MKLNRSVLVAVAMMVGGAATMGCDGKVTINDPIAPEETAASAPVDTASPASTSAGFEKDELRFHYYAPHAPPAIRVETRGRAPSERHFWAPGYWRWNGREHVWFGGRWELRRDGYEYVAPHWVNRFGRWEYIPGHWIRRF